MKKSCYRKNRKECAKKENLANVKIQKLKGKSANYQILKANGKVKLIDKNGNGDVQKIFSIIFRYYKNNRKLEIYLS